MAVCLIVVILVFGSPIITEVFFYTIPTPAEVNHRLMTLASSTPNWLSFRVVSISAVNRSQVVLGKYQRADAPLICLAITVWVKRVFSGVSTIASAGPCYNPSVENPSVQLTSFQADGYIAAGHVIDPQIKTLRANWMNGTSSMLNITDGAFLALQADGMRLLSIEGLDSRGTPITRSLTYDEETLRLTHGTSTVLSVEGGKIVVTSYSVPSPIQQECIRVDYQTRETFTKVALGEVHIPSAIACSHGDAIGPSVGVEFREGRLLVGRLVDPTVNSVHVCWEDGLEQTSSLVNGIYAFQHPNLPSVSAEVFAVHEVSP